MIFSGRTQHSIIAIIPANLSHLKSEILKYLLKKE